MIKVLIADDHALIRAGVKTLLGEEADIRVVAEARDGNEMFALLAVHPCDVLILDITMPGKSGLDLLRELRDQHPKLRVLILTMHPEERFASRAFKMGVAGYVTKESVPRELVTAIRKVAGGGVFVSPLFAETLVTNLDAGSVENIHEILSDREFQVLRLIASGHSVDEIAEKLFLSKGTIYTYRGRVLEKMGMTNDAELVRYAVEHKLMD